MFAESAAKLILSTGALGGVFYTVAAAASDLPLPPMPAPSETQTVLNILLLALAGYIIKLVKDLSNTKKTTTTTTTQQVRTQRDSPSGPNISEIILNRLEKLAYGTSENLQKHMLDFTEFRGEMSTQLAEANGRIDLLTSRVDTLHNRITGETPRQQR